MARTKVTARKKTSGNPKPKPKPAPKYSVPAHPWESSNTQLRGYLYWLKDNGIDLGERLEPFLKGLESGQIPMDIFKDWENYRKDATKDDWDFGNPKPLSDKTIALLKGETQPVDEGKEDRRFRRPMIGVPIWESDIPEIQNFLTYSYSQSNKPPFPKSWPAFLDKLRGNRFTEQERQFINQLWRTTKDNYLDTPEGLMATARIRRHIYQKNPKGVDIDKNLLARGLKPGTQAPQIPKAPPPPLPPRPPGMTGTPEDPSKAKSFQLHVFLRDMINKTGSDKIPRDPDELAELYKDGYLDEKMFMNLMKNWPSWVKSQTRQAQAERVDKMQEAYQQMKTSENLPRYAELALGAWYHKEPLYDIPEPEPEPVRETQTPKKKRERKKASEKPETSLDKVAGLAGMVQGNDRDMRRVIQKGGAELTTGVNRLGNPWVEFMGKRLAGPFI